MDCAIEDAVTVGLLLLFLTHFYIPILDPVQSSLFAASSEDQTLLGQSVNVGVWLVACCLMLRSLRDLIFLWRRYLWLYLFVGFALISSLWSQDAGITLRKAVFLILTTAFGIYFARHYSMERQMQLICISGLIAALLSIAFALLLPRYGLDHDVHEGVLVGIFTQKNVCAREMLFLLACVLPYRPSSLISRFCRVIAVIAISAVITWTESKTALLIMLLILFLFPVLSVIRRVSRSLVLTAGVFLLGVVAFAAVVTASAVPELVLLIGRDDTMTGRTDIWRAVMVAIMKHPLLGYGFSAFWLSLRGESANIILALRWAVPAAHNGFLEIWLQLGAAGLFLFAVGFLLALRSAVAGLRQPVFCRAAWPLAILLLTLVYNLDESSLMQPNDFLWILYVTTLVNLAPVPRTHLVPWMTKLIQQPSAAS